MCKRACSELMTRLRAACCFVLMAASLIAGTAPLLGAAMPSRADAAFAVRVVPHDQSFDALQQKARVFRAVNAYLAGSPDLRAGGDGLRKAAAVQGRLPAILALAADAAAGGFEPAGAAQPGIAVSLRRFGPEALPTLQIEIGDGRGKNWWCVLFSMSCFGPTVQAALLAEPQPEDGAGDPFSRGEPAVEIRSVLLDWWRSLRRPDAQATARP